MGCAYILLQKNRSLKVSSSHFVYQVFSKGNVSYIQVERRASVLANLGI